MYADFKEVALFKNNLEITPCWVEEEVIQKNKPTFRTFSLQIACDSNSPGLFFPSVKWGHQDPGERIREDTQHLGNIQNSAGHLEATPNRWVFNRVTVRKPQAADVTGSLRAGRRAVVFPSGAAVTQVTPIP